MTCSCLWFVWKTTTIFARGGRIRGILPESCRVVYLTVLLYSDSDFERQAAVVFGAGYASECDYEGELSIFICLYRNS